MIKTLQLSILTLLAFLIQTTTLKYFAVCGIIPNIMVVLVVCFSLSKTSFNSSCAYGFLCGLILDCASETIFSLHALLCLWCAAACSLISKRYFKGKYFVCILFVFLASFLYETLYYLISFKPYYNALTCNSFVFIITPTAIYNMILAPIAYFIFSRIYFDKDD